MPPNNLLRAMLPLRSTVMPGSTATTTTTTASVPFLTSTRTISTATSISTNPFRLSTSTQKPRHRHASSSTSTSTTTTTPPKTPQQQQPPSLRKYPYTLKTGTVISVGRMDRTVRVAYRHTTWDPQIRKPYPKVTTYMVADPRNSLREGDVIEFSSGYPKSRRVHHVVERIVAPFGAAIEDRPPVMSREERDAERALKRAGKLERREARRDEGESKIGEGNVKVDVKEHVGRIRGLVSERASSSVPATAAVDAQKEEAVQA